MFISSRGPATTSAIQMSAFGLSKTPVQSYVLEAQSYPATKCPSCRFCTMADLSVLRYLDYEHLDLCRHLRMTTCMIAQLSHSSKLLLGLPAPHTTPSTAWLLSKVNTAQMFCAEIDRSALSNLELPYTPCILEHPTSAESNQKSCYYSVPAQKGNLSIV